MKLSIACADVGSEAAGNFGWALQDVPGPLREFPESGSLEAFAAALVARLRSGVSVALGFECPLYVPLRDNPKELTRSRTGEGNRPWSAGAGCGALATGLVQTTWLLRRLRESLSPQPLAFFAWHDFVRSPGSILLWEAFISRTAKSNSHHGDAMLAVQAFERALPEPQRRNLIDEDSVFSLVASALLRAGWSVTTAMLSSPCLCLAAEPER